MRAPLLMSAVLVLASFGCSETPTRPDAPAPTSTEADASEPAGNLDENAARFPRTFDVAAGTVIVHTPEIEEWEGYERVTARSAIEVVPAGASTKTFGTLRFTAETDVNLELRVVVVENTRLASVSFPGVSPAEVGQLEAAVRSAIPGKSQQVPLDLMLEYIDADDEPPSVAGLSPAPPPIYVRTTPAVLVQIDGEPLLAPIDDGKLQYVINTNWDLFKYNDDTWYILNEDQWLRSTNLTDAWQLVNRLPPEFEQLPANEENWARVAAQVQPGPSNKTKPDVIVSQRPAELIALAGLPEWEPIGETGIGYAANTESALFEYQNSYYYTVSGRWFTARVLEGPWVAVTPTALPTAFADIPADHPRGAVRASIPGTPETRQAALEAQIPRKATVKRDAGKNIAVAFEGEPQFEPIDDTGVARATNAAFDILKYESEYYLCYNAVWYLSAQPDGPWQVADVIPAAIYSIPPSSPAYHVTHVHVYESDEETVETGYTSGYFGVYLSYGVPWYGTGYYYPPYWYYNPYYGYPIYYPYPYSYGFGGWYNPTTGAYGRAGAVYGPYGGYGRAAAYNPETGAYARGGAVWDSNEIAGRAIAYNPRTGTGVATRRYANESGAWGESLVVRDDKWLRTESEWAGNTRNTEFETSGGLTGDTTRTQDGDTTRIEREISKGDQTLNSDVVRGEQGTARRIEGPEGQTGGTLRTSEGDLYASKDGNVYKRGEDGWYEYGDGNWQPVEGSGERQAQLQERAQGRSREDFDRGPSASQQARNPYNDSFSSHQSDLNRSYDARRNGYSRYDSRPSTGRSFQGRGGFPRGGVGRRR